jgi:hypothetical protein
MKDNFDLKKFLKENKTLENSNKYLANAITEDDKKDALRTKVREMIITEMEDMDYPLGEDDIYEAKDDEGEVETEETEETEEDVDVVDAEDMPEDMPEDDLSDEGDIMGHLEAAMEAARSLGDEKLMDQLGNTITFYTRQHIAK